MDPTANGGAVFAHPTIPGWTLTITRRIGKVADQTDQSVSYVAQIHFEDTLRCSSILATGPQDDEWAVEHQKRWFEEWVNEYVRRDHSGDSETGRPLTSRAV